MGLGIRICVEDRAACPSAEGEPERGLLERNGAFHDLDPTRNLVVHADKAHGMCLGAEQHIDLCSHPTHTSRWMADAWACREARSASWSTQWGLWVSHGASLPGIRLSAGLNPKRGDLI